MKNSLLCGKFSLLLFIRLVYISNAKSIDNRLHQQPLWWDKPNHFLILISTNFPETFHALDRDCCAVYNYLLNVFSTVLTRSLNSLSLWENLSAAITC